MYSVKELQEIIENEIVKRSDKMTANPYQNLYSPVTYALGMGGKRLRPVLLLLGYNLFEKDVLPALPAAIAIEIFHNFTLLHDDIMDNASLRRNKPTVHKKFSENSAILSGDVMSFIAYRYLLESPRDKLRKVIQSFTQTAVEVCEGQQLDMDFEQRLDVSETEYLKMIKLKTAVLLACSLNVGALLANAPKTITEKLYQFGLNLGMAFQLQDDMLDTYGDQKSFGKKIGGDIVANKKTYLLVKTLELADTGTKKELLQWIQAVDFQSEEKILSVTKLYNRVNVKTVAEEKIFFYYQKGVEIIEQLPIGYSEKQALHSLSNNLLKRIR
ncbi:MAG: isoprenyl synthetase [Draconibacterium sp.]|nr:MAG: isoprenyl synthetase [Draconibacterium sp.]